MNPALKFLHHLGAPRSDRWYPLLAVYYLTYACRFRCPYCSDGAGRAYYRLPREVLPGGEPLEHPDVEQVLDGLSALGFSEVVFTTNGHDLLRRLPAVARGVTTLVVSLDTLDRDKADAGFGVGPGALEQILAALEQARTLPGRRYTISISAVVTPHNIEDLYEVYRYADARGFEFAACPQLEGVKAHSALHGDPAYIALFDFLIARKKRGSRVFGTVPYLERMRNLVQYRCRPFTMLVVSPTGGVFYPCLELGHHAGNLLQCDDLHALRREGQRRFGPQPACGNQCHSACALGFATVLDRPGALLQELVLRARASLHKPG